MNASTWDTVVIAQDCFYVSIALVGAAAAGVLALNTGLLRRRLGRESAGVGKLYWSLPSVLFTAFLSTVLWIFTQAATDPTQRAVLAEIAGLLLALTVCQFVHSFALLADVMNPIGRRGAQQEEILLHRNLSRVSIYAFRLTVIAAGTAAAWGTSVARDTVLPARPLWHFPGRIALVLVPVVFVRVAERILYSRYVAHPTGRCGRWYTHLRRRYTAPAIACIGLAMCAVAYFAIVASIAPSHTAEIRSMLGRGQARTMLLLLGLAFALLELNISADTMSSLHDYRISIRVRLERKKVFTAAKSIVRDGPLAETAPEPDRPASDSHPATKTQTANQWRPVDDET